MEKKNKKNNLHITLQEIRDEFDIARNRNTIIKIYKPLFYDSDKYIQYLIINNHWLQKHSVYFRRGTPDLIRNI